MVWLESRVLPMYPILDELGAAYVRRGQTASMSTNRHTVFRYMIPMTYPLLFEGFSKEIGAGTMHLGQTQISAQNVFAGSMCTYLGFTVPTFPVLRPVGVLKFFSPFDSVLKAKTVAFALYDAIASRYGVCKTLCTDQGSCFTAAVYREICEICQI